MVLKRILSAGDAKKVLLVATCMMALSLPSVLTSCDDENPELIEEPEKTKVESATPNVLVEKVVIDGNVINYVFNSDSTISSVNDWKFSHSPLAISAPNISFTMVKVTGNGLLESFTAKKTDGEVVDFHFDYNDNNRLTEAVGIVNKTNGFNDTVSVTLTYSDTFMLDEMSEYGYTLGRPQERFRTLLKEQLPVDTSSMKYKMYIDYLKMVDLDIPDSLTMLRYIHSDFAEYIYTAEMKNKYMVPDFKTVLELNGFFYKTLSADIDLMFTGLLGNARPYLPTYLRKEFAYSSINGVESPVPNCIAPADEMYYVFNSDSMITKMSCDRNTGCGLRSADNIDIDIVY